MDCSPLSSQASALQSGATALTPSFSRIFATIYALTGRYDWPFWIWIPLVYFSVQQTIQWKKHLIFSINGSKRTEIRVSR